MSARGRQLRTDAAAPAIPAGWRSEVRCDVGRLRKAERTPSGGVRVPAAIARAGVLEYRRADGSVVLELVPEDEIANPEALRTLRDATVTVGHPGGGTRMVTPATHREDSVGHVSGDPRVEGGHIVADLAIQDGDAIKRIDAGELVEISAGYSVFVDPTPGTYQGQRYDQIQRGRVYNHAALLPSGGGRAGSSVALRLDGVDVAMQVRAGGAPPPNPALAMPAQQQRSDSMGTEVIDGIEYKIGSPEWTQAHAKRRKRLDEEMVALEEKAKKADADLEAMKAERDALKSKLAEIEAKLAEVESPENLDARADARAAQLATARKVLGADFAAKRADGKSMSNHEIKRAVLAKLAPSVDQTKHTEAYLDGRYDAEIALLDRSPSSPLSEARRDAFAPPVAPPNGAPAPAQNQHTVGRVPPRTPG